MNPLNRFFYFQNDFLSFLFQTSFLYYEYPFFEKRCFITNSSRSKLLSNLIINVSQIKEFSKPCQEIQKEYRHTEFFWALLFKKLFPYSVQIREIQNRKKNTYSDSFEGMSGEEKFKNLKYKHKQIQMNFRSY